MSYFLAKTEPKTYSLADLAREKHTTWDGIKNPQALQAVRSMEPGDKVFIYHSGGESQIVGLAQVTSPARPDPKQPKSWVVDLKYLSTLHRPITLAEIKQSGLFDSWALVRQGRLSTMAVPPEFIEWLHHIEPGIKL